MIHANSLRWLGAGGVLLAGTAGALRMGTRPVRLDPVPIRTNEVEPISVLVQTRELVTNSETTGPASSTTPPAPAAPRAPNNHFTGALARPTASPAEARSPEVSANQTVPSQPTAREDPSTNIALVGITHMNGADQAWLLNLQDRDRSRELVRTGEAAFGFQVKEIRAEDVVLTQDGTDYAIRLGEKRINGGDTPDALIAADTSSSNDEEAPPGFGRGRGRGAAGVGFPPGQAFAPGGGNTRAGFGGGFAGAGQPDQIGGAGGNGPGQFGGPGGGQNGRNNQNSSGAGSVGGGGQSASSATSLSQFSAGNTGSTPNPQTAHRRGSALQADVTPIPAVQSLSNPQTERRRGTTSGEAFGSGTPTTSGGYGTSPF